jgi:MFS transporter, DHA1 family, multidrug resistance protein
MSRTPHNSSIVMFFIFLVPLMIPFGNDLFLPSLPAMSQFFHVVNVQLIMTAYLLGLALFQLLYGPLTDRFGRKPLLVAACALYALGSAFILLSPSFLDVLVGRFVQAMGACGLVVCVMAIIRDSYSPDEMIRYITMMMVMIAIGPITAPILGSWLQETWGWHASFVVLLAMGVFNLLLVTALFRESMTQKNYQALQPKKIIGNFAILLKDKSYLHFVLVRGLSYGATFAYLAAAPILFMEWFHLSLVQFAEAFAFIATPFIVMGVLLMYLKRWFSLPQMLVGGTAMITLGGAVLGLFTAILGPRASVTIAGMFITYLGIGLVRPVSATGAIQGISPKIAGSASALLAFFTFGIAAIITATITFVLNISLEALAILIVVLGAIAMVLSLRLENFYAPSEQLLGETN